MPIQEQQPGWDLDAIRSTLTNTDAGRAAAEETGPHQVAFGDDGRLDVFPPHLLRLQTPVAEVTLFGLKSPTVTAEGVIFESQIENHAARLSVSCDGSVALTIDAKSSADAVESPSPTSPAPPPTETRQGSSERATEAKKNRVRISGNIGYDPIYRALPRRELRIEFSIAEHHEDRTTTWHRVYATGEYAKRLREKGLKRGQEVTVEGSRQVSQQKQKDGSVKEVVSVFCYGVRLKDKPAPE